MKFLISILSRLLFRQRWRAAFRFSNWNPFWSMRSRIQATQTKTADGCAADSPGAFSRPTNGPASNGSTTLAFEIKASSSPTVQRGFWTAIEDVQPDEISVIGPVAEAYPLSNGVMVRPLRDALGRLAALDAT